MEISENCLIECDDQENGDTFYQPCILYRNNEIVRPKRGWKSALILDPALFSPSARSPSQLYV